MLYVRIDKEKVRRLKEDREIGAWNSLGAKLESLDDTSLRMSTRAMYDILDSQEWTTKQLYAMCEALECMPLDILSFDAKRVNGSAKKALLPGGTAFGLPFRFEVPEMGIVLN